jgi:hypothetical protein
MRVDIPATAEEIEGHEQRKRKADTVKDPALQFLLNNTPADIETYLEQNLTNLVSAKKAIITLAKAIAILGQREFKEENKR